MLTPGIAKAYKASLESLASRPGVSVIARAPEVQSPNQCQSALLSTQAEHFLTQPELQSEVFGAAALLVQCNSDVQMLAIARALEGQLTAGLHVTDNTDALFARDLLDVLETRAGRLLINGFPTGVEVCSAMVHGGPYPATSDGRTTSVGTRAIDRFLRPVCYQNFPENLLPPELKAL